MDIVTQGLLGGVLAQSVANKAEKKVATFVGVIAGLLADADILIRSSSDPLLNIEYHRHFSHSLLFIPFGAAIAFLLLWPFMRRYVDAKRLYLFCLLGYSMSGALDACTSYGTHLLWPFSEERVALNIISIIDPVFSLILLLAMVLGLRLRQRWIAAAGLVFGVAYLSLGFVQHQRAEAMAQQLIYERGHHARQYVVKPTMANLLLWRSVYIHDERIYIDAIRVSLFGDTQIFTGESVARLSLSRDLPGLDLASPLYGDIQRFIRFSDGYVAFDPSQRNVLGDIRYSMLPISGRPLWGIVIAADKPQHHADYRFFRENNKQLRQTFFNLLSGQCKVAVC